MSTNTPDFTVYGVTQVAGKKDILTRIGGAWKHQKGDGINLSINALPLNFQRQDRPVPAEVARGGRSAARRRRTVLTPGQAARPPGRAAKPSSTFKPSELCHENHTHLHRST